MNSAAVKGFFKPLSRAEQEELVRKHGGKCIEQSVGLEDVGLERQARDAAERAKRTAISRARPEQYEY